jgi:hypothetical protein
MRDHHDDHSGCTAGDRRERTDRRRRRAVVAGTLALAAGVVGGAGAVEQVGAQDGGTVGAPAPTSIISVTLRPSTIDLGPCRPGITGLTYETIDRQDSFTLRIVAATEPCTPLAAVAAAYRMPDGFAAWPQTLAERRDVVIDAAGTTDVRFAKGCVPLQFDVVTGATPATIAPWAQWHGPLLFPGDVRTALQHRPSSNCGVPTTTAPTTTAPTSTTTTASTSTTSTTAPGSNTTVTSAPPSGPTTSPGGPSATTPQPASVLGSTQTPPSTAPPAVDTSVGADGPPTVAGLALTGGSVRVLLLGGLVSVVAGLVLLAAQRQRPAR